ncbi:MAG: cyclic nucleotide-binding domain-containing protein [Mariprofundales bacterium]|nr:cyclic nucleotide-binding domain-containing protein [Mariprofundales bacterium]
MTIRLMATSPPSHPLWHNFFRQQDDWISETATMCQNNTLFDGLSPAVIRWFASRMHPRHYDAGEIIFHAGDEGAGAILLRSGTIEIRNNGIQLAVMTAGDLFGEVALVSGKERTADAIATEPCELVFLLCADLDGWIESRPKHACTLLQNLGSMLADRLLESNRAVTKQANHG